MERIAAKPLWIDSEAPFRGDSASLKTVGKSVGKCSTAPRFGDSSRVVSKTCREPFTVVRETSKACPERPHEFHDAVMSVGATRRGGACITLIRCLTGGERERTKAREQ